MLRRFIDWWNKKPNEDAIEDAYVEEVYKYETTLVRDLKIIAELLGRELSKEGMSYFHTSKETISFHTRGIRKEEVRRSVKLKSLRITDNRYGSIESYFWEADYEEYKKVYESKYLSYANIVRELKDVVRDNFNNPDYFYIFCKYEDSIYIVASTLKDEHENNNGEISEEVFKKAKEIIEKSGQAIMKRYRELEHIEELQKEAVSKSLIGRLDSEIEFIDKYLEVN